MKTILLFFFPFLLFYQAQAQRVVYDVNHHRQVMDNYASRFVAEQLHQNNLQAIATSVKNIELNFGSIVLMQDAIYRSLVEVNATLKQGILVKNMGVYISQILGYSNDMVSMAQDEPYLLLFAEEYSIHARGRVIDMANEVANLILQGGKGMMMDFTKRDELLKKVIDELIILRGASYGALNSMRFAKRNGVLKKLNPLQNYINRDKQLVNDIIFKYKYLQK